MDDLWLYIPLTESRVHQYKIYIKQKNISNPNLKQQYFVLINNLKKSSLMTNMTLIWPYSKRLCNQVKSFQFSSDFRLPNYHPKLAEGQKHCYCCYCLYISFICNETSKSDYMNIRIITAPTKYTHLSHKNEKCLKYQSYNV